MKRLGFLCPPTQRETSHVNGSFIAEKNLVRALIEYSRLERIDFISSDKPESLLDEELRVLFEENKDRVGLVSYDWLATHLSSTPYHVFFQSGPNLNRTAAFRDGVASSCVPVTTMLHSVANAPFWDPFSPLYTYPFQACDAYFCSTNPLMQVMERSLDNAQNCLSEVRPGFQVARPALKHVPLGVDEQGVVTAEERAQARVQWGIDQDALCFLCLGRLDMVAKMDLLPLLSIFRDCKVLPSFEKAKLVIAGATRDESHWEEFLKAQVEALGLEGFVEIIINFEEDERRSLYALADAFVSVSDSIQESFGIAPVEAMFCEIPVILSDWDGYKELVEHDATGFLIPTYWGDCNPLVGSLHEDAMLNGMLSVSQSVAVDAGVLRDTLVRVAEDAGLRKRVGKAARESALKRFSWKHVVARYEAIWDELNTVAQTLSWPPAVQRFPRMPVFDNFKHYATNHVNETTSFKTTVRGQRMGSGGETLNIYPGLQAWVDIELVGKLITLCLNGAQVEAMTKEVGVSKERVLYTLLWMLKHDFIREIDS